MRFNGNEKTNVEEYCVSEGWVRLAVGKTLDRKGKQLTIKYSGKVEPYFEDIPRRFQAPDGASPRRGVLERTRTRGDNVTEEPGPRKLAAIMSIDIVGYSAHERSRRSRSARPRSARCARA